MKVSIVFVREVCVEHLPSISDTQIFIVICVLFLQADAWWVRRWWGRNGNSRGCPARYGASPYYFGTTNLNCISSKKGKRGAPTRGRLSYIHRFIYYRGKYFDFIGKSVVVISNRRLEGHRCSGGREGSPAGYSTVSLSCIEGCARNYRCQYGSYGLFTNNCHDFANRMSKILCKRGSSCPTWCRGSCNHARIDVKK
ncbi:uncharacterized protein LOC133202505 [Saccostrea echinata]|uniref:uncharacterized protein LOC133202505 n=1 Tax=Saccostrea echinata TaxID=191078 RepID=UPI002A823DAB|nr:uncharacterized protein LOC133202505 [Saccostrea echinata]